MKIARIESSRTISEYSPNRLNHRGGIDDLNRDDNGHGENDYGILNDNDTNNPEGDGNGFGATCNAGLVHDENDNFSEKDNEDGENDNDERGMDRDNDRPENDDCAQLMARGLLSLIDACSRTCGRCGLSR